MVCVCVCVLVWHVHSPARFGDGSPGGGVIGFGRFDLCIWFWNDWISGPLSVGTLCDCNVRCICCINGSVSWFSVDVDCWQCEL